MSDPSAFAAIQNEDSTTPGWIQQNGENANDMKQKLNDLVSQSYPARAPFIDRKTKRKDDRPLEIVCRWIVKHQIGLSVNLLVLLCLTHICFPRARRHTRKFFELSYYNAQSGEYCAGWNDAWMVFYWIVVFTGLRAAVMDFLFLPMVRKGGVKTKRDQTRFAEQAWLLVYYSVFWLLGMYILVNSDYWLNSKNLWTDWPHREITGLQKWYILVQYAFWLQQIMVINIEERTKDHWQTFTHHIVTAFLIFTSYVCHQNNVANLILCILDVVNVILPVAKCLKCVGYSTTGDIIFGFFMAVWVAARHIIYMMICYTLYKDIPKTTTYGCYSGRKGAIEGPFAPSNRLRHRLETFQDPEGVVCWNNRIKWGFLSALLFLQCVMLIGFWIIVKVAIKVVKGEQADNVSDGEGEDEEDFEVFEELQPIEEEVGVKFINLRGRVSNASKPRYTKSAGSATGVSLPGHSDRKELLGRIGCDKGV